jgi:hypothetical protein
MFHGTSRLGTRRLGDLAQDVVYPRGTVLLGYRLALPAVPHDPNQLTVAGEDEHVEVIARNYI